MNIVVLAGGTSTEREISIVSGKGIASALRQKGHRAVLVDVFAGIGEVDWSDPFPENYDVEQAAESISGFNDRIGQMKKTRKSFWGPNVLELCDRADIVFLGLHGMNGEDGRVQATFDLMGIPYTGAGYLSSGIAMDKYITKQFFRLYGVTAPPGFLVEGRPSAAPSLAEHGLHFPVVVKTCCGGSSVGVYIVDDQKSYEKAIDDAFSYEDRVIVEQYIGGRELTCAVVDQTAYPIVEIIPREGFYDYKNKYEPGATIEICPAALTKEQTEHVQELAVRAASAMRLEGYCRLDFILDKTGEVYCLEANTLPGMTPTSLIPLEAATLGISYPDLCEELIRVSLKRFTVPDEERTEQ